MKDSRLIKAGVVVGAAVSGPTLAWLVLGYPRPLDAFGREVLLLAILALSAGFAFCWAAIIGRLAEARVWLPATTFLAAAAPFYFLACWSFFVGRWAMGAIGVQRMLLMVGYGSVAGAMARKKAYPEMSDREPPSATPPPPTLFPK